MAVKAIEQKFLDKFIQMAGNIQFNNVMFAGAVTNLPPHIQECILDVFVAVIERMASCYDKGLYTEESIENYVLARRLKDTLDNYY